MTSIDRREFVRAVGTVGALSLAGWPTRSSSRPIRAVAFDGFALFDATAVVPAAEALAPGRGAALVAAWRARHFEYQWLRTLGGRYEDFQKTASDALLFATRSLGIDLSDTQRRELVEAQGMLRPWPDAAAAIDELRAEGVSLSLLSNMTSTMLIDGLRRAGLARDFRFVLSTDRVRLAKPAPQAYAMATTAFDLPRDAIAFVAFAGWDVAGATWFGYPTAWLNRSHAADEQLDANPSITAGDLASVVRWIKSNPEPARAGAD